jgi:hypothetical protein
LTDNLQAPPSDNNEIENLKSDSNDNNGIVSNGNHATSSADLNGHLDQRRPAAVDNEPRVEPIILKRNVVQQKQRWSCKEELAFYRTLMAVGVKTSNDSVDEGDDENKILWEEFRQISKLDKTDEILNEYFHAFIAMCKKIVGLPQPEKEGRIISYYTL